MRRDWSDPIELPQGGVRFPTRRPWSYLPAAAISGLFASVGFTTLVKWSGNSPLASDAVLTPAGTVALFGLSSLCVLASVWLLFALVCRRAVTLAEGRVGWNRQFGRWWLWTAHRNVTRIRKIVVRSDGSAQGAALVLCCDGASPLALIWPSSHDTLMRTAHELAKRMTTETLTVAVGWERIGFTGERIDQPALSRVVAREDATGVTFPIRTSWRFRRSPNTLGANGTITFIIAALLIGSFFAAGLLGTATTLFGTWEHFVGRNTFHISVGPLVLVGPGPPSENLLFRVGEASLGAFCGLAIMIPLTATSWLLLRWQFREFRRRSGDVATGTGKVEIVVGSEMLTIRKPGTLGRVIAEWHSSELALIQAYYGVVTSGGEGDSSVSYTGLDIRASNGSHWRAEGGLDPEDWEWIATRIRAVIEVTRQGMQVHSVR